MMWSAWRSIALGLAIVFAVASAADAQRSRSSSARQDDADRSGPASAEAASPAAAQGETADQKPATGATDAAEGGAPPAGANGAPQKPLPGVTFVTLAQQDVTLTTLLPGRVVASGVAEVRPQVDGIIEQRLFDEGADVELGDPMYRIDPDTYDALVAAAEAQVAQAQASYNAALSDASRTQRLQDRGVVSDQNLETAIAARDTAAAGVQVAEAELQQANINLDRTTIRAQLTGVVGRSLTTQGALVTAGQESPLAVIRKIDPVLVDVTQSAAELLEFRRGQLQKRLGNADLSVRLNLADGTEYESTGALMAAEPNVDEQTGVVTLRLEFSNPDRLLLPGMYVQVEMPQGVAENVVLAPQEGVSRDRRGRPVAYVVTADDTIEERQLTVAGARGADWIVTDGLGNGDRMVVAGFQRIAPGAKVRPQERQPEPPDDAGSAMVAPSAEEAAKVRPPDDLRSDAAPARGNPGGADAVDTPQPDQSGAESAAAPRAQGAGGASAAAARPERTATN